MKFFKTISIIIILFSLNCVFCNEPSELKGVSIVAPTIRQEYMENIFANYNKQDYPKKELIIVLNKESMDIDLWKEKAKEYENVRVYKIDESNNLSQSLNFGIEKAKYDYIGRLDDDDYYSSVFMRRSMEFLKTVDADVVGKSKHFTLFREFELLGIGSGSNFRFGVSLIGGTIVAKKGVCKKIKYNEALNCFSDLNFCRRCDEAGFKVYSADSKDFCLVRRESSSHSHKVNTEKMLSTYYKVMKLSDNVEDYRFFIDSNFLEN